MNVLTIKNNQSASEAMFLALTADYEQINQISQIIELQIDDQAYEQSLLNSKPIQIDPDDLGQHVYNEIESACDNQNDAISSMFQAIADICDWSYIGRRLAAWHKVRAPWYYEN